jgi:microcystin-dependent protein
LATDATGTPTTLGIPRYDVANDAASGLGFNAAMEEIDNLLQTVPLSGSISGIAVGSVPVWNGSAWVKPSGTPDGTKFLRDDGTWAAPVSASSAPTGAVSPFAGSSAPADWLLADGSAVSRSTYAALFAVISTTYGTGDGSTTFNVPDLRGRTVAGYAASGGHSDVATLGNNDGVAAANRRPKHNHTASTTADRITGTWSPGASGGGTAPAAWSAGSVSVGPGGTAPVDAPAYIVLNYIIKT